MLTAKDLESLIGQKLSDAKVQKVLAKIPAKGTKKKDDDVYYHTYKDYGLELVEDADTGRIASIFVHSKSKPFAQYGGELPHKLDWSMSQDDVRAELGDPDQENGKEEDQWHRGRHRFGAKFKKGKLDFFYYSAM
jgi:hypothetical protein